LIEKEESEDEASTSTVVSVPKRQRPIAITRSRAAPSSIPPEDENIEMLNLTNTKNIS